MLYWKHITFASLWASAMLILTAADNACHFPEAWQYSFDVRRDWFEGYQTKSIRAPIMKCITRFLSDRDEVIEAQLPLTSESMYATDFNCISMVLTMFSNGSTTYYIRQYELIPDKHDCIRIWSHPNGRILIRSRFKKGLSGREPLEISECLTATYEVPWEILIKFPYDFASGELPGGDCKMPNGLYTLMPEGVSTSEFGCYGGQTPLMVVRDGSFIIHRCSKGSGIEYEARPESVFLDTKLFCFGFIDPRVVLSPLENGKLLILATHHDIPLFFVARFIDLGRGTFRLSMHNMTDGAIKVHTGMSYTSSGQSDVGVYSFAFHLTAQCYDSPCVFFGDCVFYACGCTAVWVDYFCDIPTTPNTTTNSKETVPAKTTTALSGKETAPVTTTTSSGSKLGPGKTTTTKSDSETESGKSTTTSRVRSTANGVEEPTNTSPAFTPSQAVEGADLGFTTDSSVGSKSQQRSLSISSGKMIGALIGGVVGVLLMAIGLIAGALPYYRRKQMESATKAEKPVTTVVQL